MLARRVRAHRTPRSEPPGGAQTSLSRLAAGVAVVGVLVGCVDHDEQSLCVSFAEYVVVADAAYAADPTGATAGDAAEAIGIVGGEVTQLRAVADGRYRAPIDELDDALSDVRRTLDALQDDAEYSTWEPLVDDTLDDIRIADARLRRVLTPACAARFAEDDE